jgi:tetratricopeptide (TPR) repeat protein
MKRYKSSLNDIDNVLGLEVRHFGALSGQARIYIKLKEYEKAILSLKKALEFYPSFKSGELIPEIEKIIKEQII